MENKENKKEEAKFDKININIISGLISIINSHLLNSFSDFYGIFLGQIKTVKIPMPIDKDENHFEMHLHINLEKIVIIDKPEFKSEKFQELIGNITDSSKNKNYQILGIFSGKSFSYPKMTIKEQMFYFTAYDIIKKTYIIGGNDISNIPFIFGVFTNGSYDKEDICYKTFENKFFTYDEEKSSFVSVKYQIANVKSLLGYQHMSVIPTKIPGLESPDFVEQNSLFLKELSNKQLEFISGQAKNEIKKVLSDLYKELTDFKNLVNDNLNNNVI